MRLRARLLLAVLLVAAGLAPATASAQDPDPAPPEASPPAAPAPPNDDRRDAQALDPLPATVTGTLVGATKEAPAVEPPAGCAEGGISVWYSFRASRDGRVVVDLQNNGDLDAVVDAFLRERSQSRQLGCDATDATGRGGVDFSVRRGQTYLIRVARLTNSVVGSFRLSVALPQPAARPPGRALPSRGLDGRVDRLMNPDDAYSVRLREGRTYRMRLSGRGDACSVSGLVYGPGTESFSEGADRFLRCDGYLTVTPGPGEGGRYSIRVSANRRLRAQQRFHLQVARAGRDDVAPGRFLRNYARVRGSLQGGRIDVVDLYRFDVTRRSDLQLRLVTSGAFDVQLLNDTGRRIRCACGASGGTQLRQRLRSGRYFALVRARGSSSARYTFSRVSRTITRTSIRIAGRGRARSLPRRTVRIGVAVSPRARGPVTVTIQKFDPVEGWQFHRRRRAQARGGRATLAFRPPTVGRWRARASFEGTRTASPSASGYARLLVAGPLKDR